MHVGEGEHAATCFWGIWKLFDRTPWCKLAARSLRVGLPRALARALIGIYEHGGFLRLGGAVSRAIRPTRGIGPSCVFADFFVDAFCVEAFDELAFRFTNVTLDAHVNDVAVFAYGAPRGVRDRLVEFTGEFHLTLELDMDAEAHDQRAAVASSKRLASAIARSGVGLS